MNVVTFLDIIGFVRKKIAHDGLDKSGSKPYWWPHSGTCKAPVELPLEAKFTILHALVHGSTHTNPINLYSQNDDDFWISQKLNERE